MASLDTLIATLGLRREASARDLAGLLGVSQPTMGRLLAGAGERICRMGRARATRYALSRALPGLGTRLPIRQVDERGQASPLGILHLLASGRHWLARSDGPGELFECPPPFAWDMSPQGYIGRYFSVWHPDLGLPPRITDWNDDHRLLALARRGEDCVGNLIVGDESFSRFLAAESAEVLRADYPELARLSLARQVGSSAGGEHPKFAVFAQGRHVLVKFAGANDGAAARRWHDLLVAEQEALAQVRAAKIQAAAAQWFDGGGMRFLEVERFDRVGLRGRKGVLSLLALAAEYLGHLESWTRAAGDLFAERRINAVDARTIRWLDTFGQLIGNTDRHFGNLAFFSEDALALRLAPVYDMLPMLFAPQGTSLVEHRFEPSPPTAVNYDVWHDAAQHALSYWRRLAGLDALSRAFRRSCVECGKAVESLIRKAPPG